MLNDGLIVRGHSSHDSSESFLVFGMKIKWFSYFLVKFSFCHSGPSKRKKPPSTHKQWTLAWAFAKSYFGIGFLVNGILRNAPMVQHRLSQHAMSNGGHGCYKRTRANRPGFFFEIRLSFRFSGAHMGGRVTPVDARPPMHACTRARCTRSP